MFGLIGFRESWGSYWVNNHPQGLYIKDWTEQNKGKNILILDSQKVGTSFLWETNLAIGGCLAGPLWSPFDCVFIFVGLPQPPIAHRNWSVQPTDSVRYQYIYIYIYWIFYLKSIFLSFWDAKLHIKLLIGIIIDKVRNRVKKKRKKSEKLCCLVVTVGCTA